MSGAEGPRGAPAGVAKRASAGGTPAREAVQSAATALRAAGVDTPDLDAQLLVAEALRVERTALWTHPDAAVAGPAARWLRDAVRARAVQRVPMSQILGRRGFRFLELRVDARVLTPRPETELLVELAVAQLAREARVADVGTGSGAIALALKHERPDLDVTASDVDPDALAVARANAIRLELDVRFLEADLLPGDGFDAVLANLPYVPDGAPLPPEVERHEPVHALRSGADGLDAIRALIAGPTAGWLALEHGDQQGPAVRALLAERGYADIATHRDLAGHERVTQGRWPPPR